MQCGSQAMTSTVTCFALTAAVAEGSEAIIKGFQALLTEVARVRLHGLSKREVDRARDMAMSDAEALYMEKDQARTPPGGSDLFCPNFMGPMLA